MGPPSNRPHRAWGTFLKKQVRAETSLSLEGGNIAFRKVKEGRMPDRGSKEEVDGVLSRETNRAPARRHPIGKFKLDHRAVRCSWGWGVFSLGLGWSCRWGAKFSAHFRKSFSDGQEKPLGEGN